MMEDVYHTSTGLREDTARDPRKKRETDRPEPAPQTLSERTDS